MAIRPDYQGPEPQADGASGHAEAAATVPPRTPRSDRSGPKRPGWYAVALLVLAGICGGLAIFGYNELNSLRLPVTATASASGRSSGAVLGSLSLTGTHRDPVHWTLQSAYVRQLTVSGAGQGQALVQLPIPLLACPQIRAKLGARCSKSGQVTLPSPVTFTWSTDALLSSGGTMNSLDIGEAAVGPGKTEVDITPTMVGYPSVCVGVPIKPSQLTVADGHGSFPYTFLMTGPNLSCDDGVSMLVGTGGGAPPVLELFDIGDWTLTASHATSALLQGFAGQLALQPGRPVVARGSQSVLMSSAGRTAVAIIVGAGQASLSVHSKAASSVVTQDGELVPSFWTRETAIVSPVLGGLVAVFVLGPLTAFMQLATDGLKNWPGPSWPRRITDWRARRKQQRAARTGAGRARS
jgi:hypothetical protein